MPANVFLGAQSLSRDASCATRDLKVVYGKPFENVSPAYKGQVLEHSPVSNSISESKNTAYDTGGDLGGEWNNSTVSCMFM